ncbi:hypothetical protein II906_04715 [bacterium]|nr:hypothetical protein [bacterium]
MKISPISQANNLTTFNAKKKKSAESKQEPKYDITQLSAEELAQLPKMNAENFEAYIANLSKNPRLKAIILKMQTEE